MPYFLTFPSPRLVSKPITEAWRSVAFCASPPLNALNTSRVDPRGIHSQLTSSLQTLNRQESPLGPRLRLCSFTRSKLGLGLERLRRTHLTSSRDPLLPHADPPSHHSELSAPLHGSWTWRWAPFPLGLDFGTLGLWDLWAGAGSLCRGLCTVTSNSLSLFLSSLFPGLKLSCAWTGLSALDENHTN